MIALLNLKSRIVNAHRIGMASGDWELAKQLSQEKEQMKKKSKRFCVDCGVVVDPKSFRCSMHANLFRYGRKLVFALALVSFVSIAASPLPIQLFWNAQPQVDVWKVYSTNDLTAPYNTWSLLVVVPGNVTNAQLSVSPGAMNFYITASNFWGETGPSNIASLPNTLTNVSGVKLTR